MGSMRFMQISNDPRVMPKIFSFDSSPGEAIARALGDLDPKSYRAELKETREGEEVYEVSMRRSVTDEYPGPHPLLVKGMITWEKPQF